jgi:hypothetical protein
VYAKGIMYGSEYLRYMRSEVMQSLGEIGVPTALYIFLRYLYQIRRTVQRLVQITKFEG